MAKTEDSTAQAEHWGSRVGVILAVAGSAVGLGNFLRFPGVASKDGGGAFMVPYFIALVLLGIPIAWAEWAMGRAGGEAGFHSAPAIFGHLGKSRIFRYVGVVGVLIPLVVYMYYNFIESWCLRYFWDYLTGSIDLGSDPAGYARQSGEVFNALTGSTENGVLFHGGGTGGIHPSFIFWIITFLLNFWLIYRGVSKGIEAFCKWAMPLMALCALVVLGRVLTLGTPDPAHPDQNVLGGLGFMWNAHFSELGNFKTWLDASGQIFFSLSVGFGVIINYASYVRRNEDIVLSGLTASATNELFEVGFGGLITIPAAFIFLGAAGASGGTFGLGFNTLPVVFEYMGPFGRFIGATWFLMLFLAAITSSLSMLQPAMAFIEEALGVGRKVAAVLLGALAGIGSLWVIGFSKGLVALDTMDFWVGTVMIFVLATVQIVIFGWIFGVERGIESAHEGAQIHIPGFFKPIMKYVAPVYLIVIFIGFCTQNLPGYIQNLHGVAAKTVGFIAAVLALLIGITWMGERRWDAWEARAGTGGGSPEGTPAEERT